MAGRLNGKVAIVTGGGGGIGRGVCFQLAQEGAAVVVNDLGGSVSGEGASTAPADQVVAAIKEQGGRAVPAYDSVGSYQGAEAIVQSALKNFGRVDIVCHLAGILRDRMVFNMTEEEWDGVLNVHLGGAFNIVRNSLPHMMRQRFGRIVLFSSSSGLGSSGQANYSAAKEGMVGYVRALAPELKPYNITANAVYPGGQTRMVATVPQTARELRAQRGITSGVNLRSAMSDEAARDPLNNAAKAAYLCTDEAGEITGQVFGTSGWPFTQFGARRVLQTLSKPGRWTLDELDHFGPQVLINGLVNPAPPREQTPQGQPGQPPAPGR